MVSTLVKSTHVGGSQAIGDNKMAIDKSNDTRYPYTYADDYIRAIAGYIQPGMTSGTKIYRSDASKIIEAIANVIEMPKEELASKLADYYLEHQTEIDEKSSEEFLATIIDRK